MKAPTLNGRIPYNMAWHWVAESLTTWPRHWVAESLTTWDTKDVQKPSGRNNSSKKGRLVSCENERKVHLEGRRNLPDGVVEESPNLLQQDNSLVDYNNSKRARHQLGKSIFLRFKAQHGEVVIRGYQATYIVCGPCCIHVITKVVSIWGPLDHWMVCGNMLLKGWRGYRPTCNR